MPDRFDKLEKLISNLPAVDTPVSSGIYENGFWWVKFDINLEHPLSWRVVQVLAHSINYLSISERLSTVFYPLSPSPFAEGVSLKSMYWIIEFNSQDFSPNELSAWLESRLPAGNDKAAWALINPEYFLK